MAPVLNITVSDSSVGADGEQELFTPHDALLSRGPVCQVTVSLADASAGPILAKGNPIPEPLSGYALIDTGASVSCIDCDSAERMGLPIIDQVQLVSASHQATPKNIFPVKFEVAGLAMPINVNRVVGAELQQQGLIALLGRDLLQHCVLCYNGMTGQVTLAI